MAVNQESIASQLTAGVTAVNAAISTVGTMEGAGVKVLSTVAAAVENALAGFDSGIAILGADIDQDDVGGVAAGPAAPELAAALTTQTAEMQQLAVLVTARAYLARVGVNVEEAPG